jgi:hypothetical protein
MTPPVAAVKLPPTAVGRPKESAYAGHRSQAFPPRACLPCAGGATIFWLWSFDVARRLKRGGDGRQSLERALDWFADGVALLRADGTVVYANDSFQTIARRADGIRLRKNLIEFADAEARDKLDAAIATVLRFKTSAPDRAPATDFIAPRSAGDHPYVVAVRPFDRSSGAAAGRTGGGDCVLARARRQLHRDDQDDARSVRAYRSRSRAGVGAPGGNCTGRLRADAIAHAQYRLYASAPIAGENRLQPDARARPHAQ